MHKKCRIDIRIAVKKNFEVLPLLNGIDVEFVRGTKKIQLLSIQ